MDRSKTLTTLVGVRERRGRQLENEVQAALRREMEAKAGVSAAQQVLEDALADESRERDKLRALTDPGQRFDIGMLMLREHVAETRKDAVVRQQREVERCTVVLDQSSQDVRLRRADVLRNRRKIETLQADLQAWRAARQLEQDDLQDEESEEAAISRMLLGSRASQDGCESPA